MDLYCTFNTDLFGIKKEPDRSKHNTQIQNHSRKNSMNPKSNDLLKLGSPQTSEYDTSHKSVGEVEVNERMKIIYNVTDKT